MWFDPLFLALAREVLVRRSRRTAALPHGRLKILPVRVRGYIEAAEAGHMRGAMTYFWVPKGDSDIRMVYDGTGCGLNDLIWAMHFGLPTIRHTMRSVLPGYYQ